MVWWKTTLEFWTGSLSSIPAGVLNNFNLLWASKGWFSLEADKDYIHLRVFLGKKQINPRNVTVGLIKLEANKQSQHDPHEANNFYCVFSPNKANGGIYWTFSIIVQWGKLLVNLFKPSRSTFRCKSASRPWFEFRACFSCVWIFRRASISDQILRGVERQGYSDLNHQAVQVM